VREGGGRDRIRCESSVEFLSSTPMAFKSVENITTILSVFLSVCLVKLTEQADINKTTNYKTMLLFYTGDEFLIYVFRI